MNFRYVAMNGLGVIDKTKRTLWERVLVWERIFWERVLVWDRVFCHTFFSYCFIYNS